MLTGRAYPGQSCPTRVASQRASAALTAMGFSWAIQWPVSMISSESDLQRSRIGSARRECTVSQT